MDADDVIDAWLAEQQHPLVDASSIVCRAVSEAEPAAVASIKWKAPNWALADDFATLSARRPDRVQLILHTGATAKPEHAQIIVDDLAGRLRWADRNRAVVTWTSVEDAESSRAELVALVRAWVAQLED